MSRARFFKARNLYESQNLHNHANDCIERKVPIKKKKINVDLVFIIIALIFLFCSNDHIAAQTWLSIFYIHLLDRIIHHF